MPVGPESDIPNIEGYRTDVLQALKELKVPVMRWPGGCFADEYHWMDGIGPRADRPRMVNSNWGGTVEDNSFGTHEFLNLCEMIGCEPYISGNVGSGSVEELAKWVEYMTAADGPMAKLRAQNGRKEPWKVKYLGVGNESWGCGGNMVPEYVHQDAIFIPTTCDSEKFTDSNGRQCPYVDVTASRDSNGRLHITLTNTSLEKGADVAVDMTDCWNNSEIVGEILTSKDIHDHNDFDRPDAVRPSVFKDFKIKNGILTIRMPAKSIISIETGAN